MKHYPDPIKLPDFVPTARAERESHLVRAAGIGIVIRLGVILVELIGVAYFQSSALLLDALSSLLDVAATLLLIVFIKLAARPPDKNHPFGHGRFEPFAGLQLGLLLAVVGAGMFFQQGLQLFRGKTDFVIDSRTWIIPFFAVIVLEICYRIMMRVAKQRNSPALVVEAFHFRIDGINSLFAAVVLILGAFFPTWSIFLDHFGAILISVLMVGMGIYSIKDNMNQLLDRIPDNSFFEIVKKAAKRVPGVMETEKIRIQLYGPDAHVDIDIELDPHLSVEKAHKISQETRAEIQKAWPAVRDVTVHVEPYYENDH